ncbi:MAG: PrsW family intramembrane metalloprotease, partial [Bacteroidia bacterium]
MFLIYIFLFIILLGFINFLIQKFRKDIKLKRKFYDFGDSSSVVLVLLLTIGSYFFINFCLNDPTFKDSATKIEYGKKTIQPWLESSEYRNLVQKDTGNIDQHYKLLMSHFDENQDMGPDVRAFNQEGRFIYNYYKGLSVSANTKKSDIGNLFLGIYYYETNDKANCLSYLENVQNKRLKYLNTYLGLIYYYYNDSVKELASFKSEIANCNDRRGAYYNLSRIYDHEKQYDKIVPFVYDDYVKQFIPYGFRQRAHLEKHDIYNYFRDLFRQVFANTNIIGFFGALFILLIWIMYLIRVNVYQKGKYHYIFLTVLLSASFIFPVALLYDTYKYLLGFDLNGNVINDSLYCVFGIGVIEELVKFIPFLIILKFTKVIKEPIDYIMYASLSALGFAFVENFRYFEDGSINIIHSRALTASIAHMIFSSVVAYGFIIAKFRKKKNVFLTVLLFFFIAAFGHGFYDFWLLNKEVSDFSLFTFICLLTGILVYASFINNALNISRTSSDNINLNTGKLASDLAASLIGVFLFEFICLVIIYGPTIGNREFISSTISSGYLILFISVRLSNLDIIPGEWSPIDFFVGLMPTQIIYGDKKPNYNSLVG